MVRTHEEEYKYGWAFVVFAITGSICWTLRRGRIILSVIAGVGLHTTCKSKSRPISYLVDYLSQECKCFDILCAQFLRLLQYSTLMYVLIITFFDWTGVIDNG